MAQIYFHIELVGTNQEKYQKNYEIFDFMKNRNFENYMKINIEHRILHDFGVLKSILLIIKLSMFKMFDF